MSKQRAEPAGSPVRIVGILGQREAGPRNETEETASLTVVAVSAEEEAGASLVRIFRGAGWTVTHKPNWTVIRSTSVSSALSRLRETPAPIVLCDCDLAHGTWQTLWEHLSLLPDPPLFIVTSRLADDRLWAEALNLGAYDVLGRPFNAAEVVRTVSSAWQHWQARHVERTAANGAA